MPPILVHHVERSRSLHEAVVLLTVQKATIPVVPDESRYQFSDLGDGFYKLIVSFGYMEDPHLIPVLREVAQAEHLHSILTVPHTTSAMRQSLQAMKG